VSQGKLNFVAGEWVSGSGDIVNINPSDTRDVIGIYAQASLQQVDDTIQAARAAQPKWVHSGLEHRYNVLMSIGEELKSRSTEIGLQLSREEGKPKAEGIGEVFRAGQFFTYYAAEVLRQIGDSVDSVRGGIEVDVRHEPVGVVAIISPWNFPIATACWKIAPALAFGNAVIWKPANLTPESAVLLSQIVARQDIPPGLFSLVMGSGSAVGQSLVESKGVGAVSFTGSSEVGKGVAVAAAQNLTKVQLEMGSKNALAVMDDADLDLAVSCAVAGAFGGTGQKCTASSRLIVHEAVHDAFVARLVAATRKLKVGHALEEGTQIGPVVSDAQLEQILSYVDLAEQEGCERLLGGNRIERPTPGHFMEPTLFAGAANTMRVCREEIFGPVACIVKVSGYDEALAVVNDTDFGLTAGIMTTSLSRAAHFRRHANVGCVMVNLPTAGTDYHVPFGGHGDSGYGSAEQGRYAVEFYTKVKTSYVSAGCPQ
jgi:aldehyde dehydrogenase (NAD+)